MKDEETCARGAERLERGLPEKCSHCQSFDLRSNFNGDRWFCHDCGFVEKTEAPKPIPTDFGATFPPLAYMPQMQTAAERADGEVAYLRQLVPVMRELGVQSYGSVMLATNAAEVANQVNEALLAHLGGPRPKKKAPTPKPATKLRAVPSPEASDDEKEK